MNRLYQKAIELRYQHVKYEDISKALGGKIKTERLRHLFEEGGILYFDYLQYEAKMNRVANEAMADEFAKDSVVAAEIMRGLLQKAIKRGDIKTAFEILKEQMDRSGFVVIRKTKLDTTTRERKPQTYEEFRAECERQGIDPDTGLRRRTDVEETK